MSAAARPRVATIIGDPCGIGPEVVAKALASGAVHEVSVPVLIGSAEAMRQAARIAGVPLEVRTIEEPEQATGAAQTAEIIDPGTLDPAEITLGQVSAACGRASAEWLRLADELARAGRVAATVMGPINTEAMGAAGVLGEVISPTPGESYLFLITGPLRVVHLTDHVPLREVSGLITAELVADALGTVHEALTKWGVPAPRIGVAGFNPHAKGEEEATAIAPGIERARAAGIDAQGPVPPDTVFRQCIEGAWDCVLAMYHDQGHIAVKTWGFIGNCAIILGPPYPHLSVAHGTAFDIAGKGIASPDMMQTAMVLAGHLAAGRGFPEAPAPVVG